ncbi:MULTISPECIES: MarR family winged helix-turn-helix transcriptional regulator [Bradyrhizobium]|uniref:MarR family winged helix-turn-helix transcriptional regulator n=1 Tax=Bradyrhizobium elkanii TaxID=29448 RepID=UPI000686DCC4|nr:MarR family transcriptional regulator [Bradyrhizobium elkanii]
MRNYEASRRFISEVTAMVSRLEAIRHYWARHLGITDAQWIIIVALAELDGRDGVSVEAIAKALQVNTSFVVRQLNLLERAGLLQRKSPSSNTQLATLSLTEAAYSHLAMLSSEQDALHELILAEFGHPELDRVIDRLAGLNHQLEKAAAEKAPLSS